MIRHETSRLAPVRFRAPDTAQAFAWLAGTVVLYAVAISGGDAATVREVIIALMAVTAFGIARDATRDLRAVFRAKNLVMVFVFYWVLLNIVQWTPDVAQLDDRAVSWAAARYCLFVTVMQFAYVVVRGARKISRVVARSVPGIAPRLLVVVPILIFVAELLRRLAFVGFSLSTLVAETLKARSGPVAFGRGRFGDWRVFLEWLPRVFGMQPLFAGFAWDFAKTSKILKITLVVSSFLTFTALFFGGSRGALAQPAILLLSYRLLVSPPAKRWRWAVGAALVAVLLAPVMDLMVHYRGTGWDLENLDFRGVAVNPLKAKRDANFSAMAKLMTVIDREGGRDPLELYFFMLISPIPRVLWPGKPYMSQEYLGETRAYYASVSCVGDMYIYGGMAHVLVGALVLAWVVKSMDLFFCFAAARREWLMVYVLLVWGPVVALRAVWSGFFYLQIMVLGWIVLKAVARRRRRRFLGKWAYEGTKPPSIWPGEQGQGGELGRLGGQGELR